MLVSPNASAPPSLDFNMMGEIERRFALLSPGKTVFNPPLVMTVAKTERIVARIAALGQDQDILKNLLGQGAPILWKQEHITPTMKARLVGEDFTITTSSPEEQLIGTGSFAEWIWNVTPLDSGEKDLEFHISAVLNIRGFEKVKDFPVTIRRVRVRVNPIHSVSTFVANNWVSLGGWLVAAVTLLWRWLKRRRHAGFTS